MDITDDIPPGDWLSIVASLLPLPHRAGLPYTLGEAVVEFGLWAKHARPESWRDSKNRGSLNLDIAELSTTIGPRLHKRVREDFDQLCAATERDAVSNAADRFAATWRSRSSVAAAFRDLCDAANTQGATSWDLRKRADILASQLGHSGIGAWGALREAARQLEGDPRGLRATQTHDNSFADRLRLAEELLIADPPTGDVVVWLVYQRARVNWRVTAGPVTLLSAEWMVPNALQDDGQDFPERNEIRSLRRGARWIAELEQAVQDPENRLVLARVGLGHREVAGAVEYAERLVEAMLSIAVGGGGVSWRGPESSATVVDSQVASSSIGLRLRKEKSRDDDTYGIGATSEILQIAAERLDVAMSERPMPDALIEALTSLREAGMTDHRDVLFYGARAVTPRVATALEDHAMELIATFASLNPRDLMDELVDRETDRQLEQRVLGGIMAPFDHTPTLQDQPKREAVERAISRYDDGGTRIVSVSKALELQTELRSLPMDDLARADLTAAFAVVTRPAEELELVKALQREVAMMRARHRRVRNAINHGNPLGAAALESVRTFGERTAHEALAMALNAYSTNTPVQSLMKSSQDVRQNHRRAREAGIGFLERNPDS